MNYQKLLGRKMTIMIITIFNSCIKDFNILEKFKDLKNDERNLPMVRRKVMYYR